MNKLHNKALKFFVLTVAISLILSLTVSSANAEMTKKTDSKDAKKIDSKKAKKTATKKSTTPAIPATPAVPATPASDVMKSKLDACKLKKTQREQYECEKALKSGNGNEEFKSKATKTMVGPIAFYYAGAKVEKTGGKDIVNLKFLVENTDKSKNITLMCTGPAVCNYDVSDGTTTYKYASQDFTNGQIVLKPGGAKMFNMLFGPAIGYGSYVEFKFDPSKQYTFNVKESWGSAKIPLNLK